MGTPRLDLASISTTNRVASDALTPVGPAKLDLGSDRRGADPAHHERRRQHLAQRAWRGEIHIEVHGRQPPPAALMDLGERHPEFVAAPILDQVLNISR